MYETFTYYGDKDIPVVTGYNRQEYVNLRYILENGEKIGEEKIGEEKIEGK